VAKENALRTKWDEQDAGTTETDQHGLMKQRLEELKKLRAGGTEDAGNADGAELPAQKKLVFSVNNKVLDFFAFFDRALGTAKPQSGTIPRAQLENIILCLRQDRQ